MASDDGRTERQPLRLERHVQPRIAGASSADDSSTAATVAPPDEARTAGSTIVRPRPVRAPVDHLPRWKVLLHNDDRNSMVDVVVAIRQLTSLPTPQATQCMLEAHTRGVSLLLTTHREHAELLQEQFSSKKLTVSIEPDA